MSYRPKALPPPLAVQLEAALRQAEYQPARRSEILGHTAMGLVAASQRPEHKEHASLLHAMAEQIAGAAMVAGGDPGPATLDDFEEQLQEFDTAHEEFSGDQDVLARADDLHDLKTSQHGSRVSIAPLSWGKGATLGRSGRFKYNPSQDDVAANVAQTATLAYWIGEPHEAQAVTVDVALVARPSPLTVGSPILASGDTTARAYAIVSFGSDGAITSVKVDVGFGTRLTVPGSYVSVVVGMDPPPTDDFAGELSYCASIGAFAAPSVAPVFCTEYIDSLSPTPPDNLSRLIQRPAHATQILSIMTSAATGGFVTLKFFGMGAGGVAGLPLYGLSYNLGLINAPIPLPGAVQYIQVENDLTSTASFAIPFQLSL